MQLSVTWLGENTEMSAFKRKKYSSPANDLVDVPV